MTNRPKGTSPRIASRSAVGVALACLLAALGCSAGPAGPAGPRDTVQPTETSGSTDQSPGPIESTGAATPAVAVPTLRAFITGYSYFDNTPPGSVQISHPVRHSMAGGQGTYEDPITVAVGHARLDGDDVLDWPAGTMFYVPNLRRYLVVEDTCGDGPQPQDGPCHTGYPDTADTWLDVWIGGEGGTERGSEGCMRSFTGVWDVVVNPTAEFAVDAGDIYSAAGCAEQYGDELTTN